MKPLFDEAVTTEKEYGIIIGKLMDASTIARPIWVTVRKFDGKHSDKQRRTFHMLVGELAKEAQHVGKGIFLSEENWKRIIIKACFGEVEHPNLDGTVDMAPRTSSSLKMSEYAQLITFLLDWVVVYFDGELTLQIKDKS